MNLSSLESLFRFQLFDLQDAETRMREALPAMASAATDSGLEELFTVHLEETEFQIERLRAAFDIMEIKPDGHRCGAVEAMVKESEEIVRGSGRSSIADTALIATAQRMEHYEIACYGTACSLARELELIEVATLLHDTLGEETDTDHKLTKLAEGGILRSGINKEAERSSA